MRLYLEVGRRSFQRHLAYRQATLAGLFTNSIFGIMIASVFIGLYRSREAGAADASVQGFTLPEMMTYVWVAQALIMVIYIWGWWEVATSIQTGDIVTDLMKPIDYYAFWLSRDLGRAACHVVTRFVPTFLIGLLLYELALPGSILTWLAFGVSVVLAVVVSFAFRFIVNLSAFWLLDVKGVGSIAMVATNFLSGFLIPIPFFPTWLRTATELLPFRAIVMLPIEIALGHHNLLAALGLQLFWAVALTLLARMILARAVRKVVIQGG